MHLPASKTYMYLQLSIPDLYTFEFIYYVKLQPGLDKLISMLSFLVYAIYLVGIALTGLTLPHVSACLCLCTGKIPPEFGALQLRIKL